MRLFKRAASQPAGNQGEQLARQYLERQGYRFLAANWRCKVGEIDLIMQDKTTRVFVEVRLRRPTTFGAGFETVGWQKQRKLLRAVAFYQQKENYWGDVRFDIVSIEHSSTAGSRLEHIVHAFSSNSQA